jgi:hypothetical protein
MHEIKEREKEVSKMATYKEYKKGLKEQRERAQAIRNEVFSDKAEKLETDLVRISNGDVYKIIPRFGTKYEDSRIIKLDPEDVEYHVEEARKVRELAKVMASKD